jgi:hypothetical protein
MKPAKVVFFLLCTALVASAALPAAVQRLALVAGANAGGPDRPVLKYAVSDAERFARVLLDLGGVSPANAILLKQPKLRELEQALDQLRSRIAEARRIAASNGGGRTEVLVYYSGHADDKGLLLGEDRYSYRSLRDRLDDVAADVRIAVLDACASGAITRIKGGVLRPPFLVDESADMRGHAFLTSSAETEAAQESDRIRGSYFTHFLISGLRGAADASGEGKVTLNEAYQFAFNETLGRTAETKGGAQHPSYDINLSRTGDVVMTDLRQTSATLVLGETLDGRFFVSNARQRRFSRSRSSARATGSCSSRRSSPRRRRSRRGPEAASCRPPSPSRTVTGSSCSSARGAFRAARTRRASRRARTPSTSPRGSCTRASCARISRSPSARGYGRRTPPSSARAGASPATSRS